MKNVNKICKFCFDSFAPCVALCQHLCKTHNCICEEHVAYTTIIFNIIRLDVHRTCLALGAPISIRCACVLIISREFAAITICHSLAFSEQCIHTNQYNSSHSKKRLHIPLNAVIRGQKLEPRLNLPYGYLGAVAYIVTHMQYLLTNARKIQTCDTNLVLWKPISYYHLLLSLVKAILYEPIAAIPEIDQPAL
ncbi:hypothetical protein T05_3398 [Trichinella murrelli]|nr:hypothetical protein T05_3398 [Trichinella murrelli]